MKNKKILANQRSKDKIKWRHVMFEKDWSVIKKLANLFESKSITYHFDASTAVFIHGIEFEMDDIDIVFTADEEYLVREALIEYRQGETKFISETFKYFFTTVDEKLIHCMFYGIHGQIENKHIFNSNTDCINVDGQDIMAKSLQFYLKYSRKNDDLKYRIKQWLAEHELDFEPY